MALYVTDKNGKLKKVAGNTSLTSDDSVSAAILNSLNKKVDKQAGKGLSTNDFTNEDKTKLDGIEANATHTTVDADLNSSSSNPVQNAILTAKITELTNTLATLSENFNTLSNQYATLKNTVEAMPLKHHPVNSLYLGWDKTNPREIFGGGTWELVSAGRAIWTATDNISNDGERNTWEANGYRYISAGLPNITGHTTGLLTDTISNTAYAGALYAYGTPRKRGWQGSDADEIREIGFNANRSSSIYGNSNTVQPPAVKVYLWRRTA